MGMCKACGAAPATDGGWCDDCNHTNHCARHGLVRRTDQPEPCPYCSALLMEQAQRCDFHGCAEIATKGISVDLGTTEGTFWRTESYGIWCDQHHDWMTQRLAAA